MLVEEQALAKDSFTYWRTQCKCGMPLDRRSMVVFIFFVTDNVYSILNSTSLEHKKRHDSSRFSRPVQGFGTRVQLNNTNNQLTGQKKEDNTTIRQLILRSSQPRYQIRIQFSIVIL